MNSEQEKYKSKKWLISSLSDLRMRLGYESELLLAYIGSLFSDDSCFLFYQIKNVLSDMENNFQIYRKKLEELIKKMKELLGMSTLKMKKYDFKKAKRIIDERKDEIILATLGMLEDFGSTREEVYADQAGYFVNLEEINQICGIEGSSWATPVLVLRLKSGKEEIFECFIETKGGEEDGK